MNVAGHCQSSSPGRAQNTRGMASLTENPRSWSSFTTAGAMFGSPPASRQPCSTCCTNSRMRGPAVVMRSVS